ncbi:MAG: hypothetical protein H0X33_05375 [Taibaiella sp.]|nr:hypothetical protein [Taibaiella sp.]
MNLAFTLTQARAICRDFQYLVNEHFYRDYSNHIVACVVVSPFDDINKWMFINNYMSVGSAAKALSNYYVPYYDVVIIGNSKADEAPPYCDIRTYLANRDIKFDREYYLSKY